MDPRLQAGLELQLEKQAQQEYESSLSGVLGQYFKQAAEPARGGGEGDTGEAERPDTFSSILAPTNRRLTGSSPSRRALDYFTGPDAGDEAFDIANKNIAQAADWAAAKTQAATDLARKGVDRATAKTQAATDWARKGVDQAAAKTQSAVGGALSGILSKYIAVSKPLNQATKAVQETGGQSVQVPGAAAGVVTDTASAAGSNLKYILKRRQQEADAKAQRRQQEADAKAQEPYDLSAARALRRRNIARERLENEGR